MDYENHGNEQQQSEQQQSSGSATSNSSSDNSSSTGNSSNNSSSSNLLVNLPMLQSSSIEDADVEQLPLHPATPVVVGQQQIQEAQSQQELSQVNEPQQVPIAEQQQMPAENSLFMTPLQQQQQQSNINNSIPTHSLSTSSSSSSTASSSTNSNDFHLYQHHHQHEHYHIHSEHSQQLQQQSINHHQHSPPPSPLQLNALSSSTITVAGPQDTTTNTTGSYSGNTTNASTTTNTTNRTVEVAEAAAAREVPTSLNSSGNSQQQPSTSAQIISETSTQHPSLALILPHLTVPETQQQSEQQQQQEEEEEGIPGAENNAVITLATTTTATPPPPPSLHLSSLAAPTTALSPINPTSTYAHYQQAQQHSPLHYTQYNQHSHHYHTPAGCSNILGGYYTNNGQAMFTNNDSNNSATAMGSASATGAAAAAAGSGSGTGVGTVPSAVTQGCSNQPIDRLKLLYPNVDETITPLPRNWSAHDKCLAIGLSQNNLRVFYKGIGKQHNDAASVRTAHPIPAACGLYYFEVKIVSKGKNGYMGIGLTAQQFRMNRLPGWDKQSYGYHGDDGHSFSSSGNGQAYGPTFTTGDIIGCCVNFVNNTCFYTKNGIDLGIAFRDLPNKLYPTVGLQTPGEELDANFGQEPFKFDQIEDMMKQMRAEMKTTIYDFPMPAEMGDTTALLHKLVSSYLVHNGYTQTIESFARSTGQTYREELPSIRSRQKILKLVMAGQMGQAIEYTMRYYPGLLENNKKLWFMLKCRQFIEMINGSDEYCPNSKITTQTQTTPPNQTSVIQSTKSYQNGKGAVIPTDNNKHNHNSTITDGASANGINKDSASISSTADYMNDVEMENNGHATNGKLLQADVSKTENIYTNYESMDEDMEIDMASHRHTQGIERILDFGKELFQMSQQLEKESRMSEEERQMLENAFSLIAYSNPWSSPMGWQLCPSKRESVCTALNSAILESLNYPSRPPLNIAVAHAAELLKLMAHTSIGACAFVDIEDVFPKN